MAPRFLLGPVTNSWATERLPTSLFGNGVHTFGWGEGTDAPLDGCDSWDQLVAKFASTERPDGLLLLVGEVALPNWIWMAPVPIVALVMNPAWSWHHLRKSLKNCDRVVTGESWHALLDREGFEGACPMPWLSLEKPLSALPMTSEPRDIDVLLVGSLHGVADQNRLPWLRPIARLSEDWRVVVHTQEDPASYRPLLSRARIVVNVGNHLAWQPLGLEASMSGALFCSDAANPVASGCTMCRLETIESTLERHLRDESARAAKVEKDRNLVAGYKKDASWSELFQRLERDWPSLMESAANRMSRSASWSFQERMWHLLAEGPVTEPTLVRDLAARLAQHPHDADAHNTLGVTVAFLAAGNGPITSDIAHSALEHFQRAIQANPLHLIAHLNLVEVFVGLDHRQEAIQQTRALLQRMAGLDRLDDDLLDAGHFPPDLDWFRIAWERSAWQNPGDPAQEAQVKLRLMRWRLHQLLADLTGELSDYFESEIAYPGVPANQAALGCKLGREGRPLDAVVHLDHATRSDPLDLPAARALYYAYGETQNFSEQRQLQHETALLHRVGLLPAEPWFQGTRVDRIGIAPVQSPSQIAWHGAFESVSSLALVNREICTELLRRGHEVAPVPNAEPSSASIKLDARLAERLRGPATAPADVTVGSQRPPSVDPPTKGHWVIMQAWEFGSLPKEWIEPLSTQVDEIWVPSSFVRQCFVQSGIPADRVHVVPLGVKAVREKAAPFPLKSTKRFKFLFVGGTIHRKGIDILLQAFRETFTSADDVCLVIKDMGKRTVYQGQTHEGLVARVHQDTDAPEIEYLDQDLTDAEMAGLYAACDCLVHPYRGEGFSLPIVEAMANGLPVIVTGYGAALDFCSNANAYLVPARLVPFGDNHVGAIETVDIPWLAEPNVDVLRSVLRRVVDRPEEAKVKGLKGRSMIERHFTWESTATEIEHRLAALRQQPIRRFQPAVMNFPAPTPSYIVSSIATSSVPAPVAKLKPHQIVPGVSLCMIVKNEEANIGACLETVRDLVDEIVVVDTGSTDATKRIAEQSGAKVFDFPWIDNFAAARNESLRHATREWIFWMDADDRLDEENRKKMRAVFSDLPDQNVAYVMECLCLPDFQSGLATVVDHVRLFRNDPRIRWKYRVHEQILLSVRALGGEVRWADPVIHHTGYQDPERRPAKLQRDLRLLQLDQADHPNEPFTLFNLGWSYTELGEPAEALRFLKESLAHSGPQDSIVRKLYVLMSQCHSRLGQSQQAIEACREGLRKNPNDPELLFEEAMLLTNQDNLPAAEACLVQLLNVRDGTYFASVDPALRGYKAYHQLGVIYFRQHRITEARRAWQTALSQRVDYTPTLLGLLDLELAARNWSEFDAALDRLSALPTCQVESEVFRARAHLARMEYGPARSILDDTIHQFPKSLWPRVILSHVLLQQHSDLDAAESALRDVLEIAPNHVQSQQNLRLLLEEKGRQAKV